MGFHVGVLGMLAFLVNYNQSFTLFIEISETWKCQCAFTEKIGLHNWNLLNWYGGSDDNDGVKQDNARNLVHCTSIFSVTLHIDLLRFFVLWVDMLMIYINTYTNLRIICHYSNCHRCIIYMHVRIVPVPGRKYSVGCWYNTDRYDLGIGGIPSYRDCTQMVCHNANMWF